ncbi:DNA double-strand break repair rad50 ATPase, putative [Babesia ovata]|uniref:DNA double-strand break repair rad50 ATPase, putative n=1 Tax=Babesia ovata TaxID=189622 RepID=A0A2H6KAM4_9APIC|nr:DNA double-strand break repair rad50 ATPase, putative [Babesia ovata]GBE60035.1 DNA double-strand break repair rad50 ATPase, putative [Babesia ovata]
MNNFRNYYHLPWPKSPRQRPVRGRIAFPPVIPALQFPVMTSSCTSAMFRLLNRRFSSAGLDVFISGVSRYRLLSASDKRKLLEAHRQKVSLALCCHLCVQSLPEAALKDAEKALDLRSEHAGSPSPGSATSAPSEQPTPITASHRIAAELKRLKGRLQGSGRFHERHQPIGVGVSKFFMGVDPNTPLEPYDITTPLFDADRETETLVSDVKKAAAYDDVQSMLSALRPVRQDALTDRLEDVMSRAIERNVARLERPVLFNELSDFESSYAMNRAAMRNLLANRCTRNAFEETRIERFLDRLKISEQRLDAPLPPEAVEPLMAFQGYSSYSFDPCVRDESFLKRLGTPEEYPVGPDSKYPFRNYFAFDSCIPNDVTGSIRMGKRRPSPSIRYPNLQSVAHSLPADRKYRAVVSNAIRTLERSKGWDHASKVKAINRLVQVYNNLAPSRYYSRVLDKAVPSVRAKGSVVRTRSRQETFNKGLHYIQSLTRNHWMKRK